MSVRSATGRPAPSGLAGPTFEVARTDLVIVAESLTVLHAGLVTADQAIDRIDLLDSPRLRRVRLRMAAMPASAPAGDATFGALLTLARWPRADVEGLAAELTLRAATLLAAPRHLDGGRRRLLRAVTDLGRHGSLGALAAAPLLLGVRLMRTGDVLHVPPGAPVLVSYGSARVCGESDRDPAAADPTAQPRLEPFGDGGPPAPGGEGQGWRAVVVDRHRSPAARRRVPAWARWS